MATLSSIEKKLKEAARDIAEELLLNSTEIMQNYIDKYYYETPSYFPKSYNRTDSFKENTLQDTGVYESGNGYGSVIYFDPSSYKRQGLDSDAILEWNMHGRHGGHYKGANIWEVGTDDIKKEYGKIAAGVLKKHGIPFK